MRNEKTHSALLGLVGGFVLILAYELLQKYLSGSDEMPGAVFIIAIAVFTLGGIGTIYYAWICYRNWKREEQEKQNEQCIEEPDGKK